MSNLNILYKDFLISGYLYDQNMKPISNANVTDLQTNTQAQTDIDGAFSINVASMSDDIKFSHASFDYDTIKASEFNSYYQLYPNSTQLDDVNIALHPKQKTNVLGWIVGIGITILVASHLTKEKPQKVKV